MGCNYKVKETNLSYYLSIAGGRIVRSTLFPSLLALCEMQTVSSRIWTQFPGSISSHDSCYTISVLDCTIFSKQKCNLLIVLILVTTVKLVIVFLVILLLVMVSACYLLRILYSVGKDERWMYFNVVKTWPLPLRSTMHPSAVRLSSYGVSWEKKIDTSHFRF